MKRAAQHPDQSPPMGPGLHESRSVFAGLPCSTYDSLPCAVDKMAGSSAALAVLGPDGRIVSCTTAFAALLNVQRSEAISESIDRFGVRLGLSRWSVVQQALEVDGLFTTARLVFGPGGKRQEWGVSLHAVPNDGEPGFNTLVVGHDMTKVIDAKKDLELKAFEDPLTGLANRRYLTTIIDELLERMETVGFIVIDLDGFKQINDTHGHEVGDLVLTHIAITLREAVNLEDIVVRLGGDEFVVVVPMCGSEDELAALAQLVERAVARPFAIGPTTHSVHASVGTSLFPDHGISLKPLLMRADSKMYQAKSGKAVEPTNPRASVLQGLGEAIRRDRIEPFYQPIVDIETGKTFGFEALARWRHPVLGKLMPLDFIPVAEANGLIAALDRAVFTRVCQDLAKDTASVALSQKLFVNLSSLTVAEPDLGDFLSRTLTHFALSADRFCIELSESMELNASDPGRDVLYDLADLGFSIALDDFGTGFSSLALLKSLPVSWIKIDKSFVQDMVRNQRDRRIVESIHHLAESLDTRLIAEGIETRQQCDLLAQIGLKYGQGYLFRDARPLASIPPASSVAAG